MSKEELFERLKSAKTEKEVQAIMAEQKERTRLSLEDLDHVAGGTGPQTFRYGDVELTRQELMDHVAEVKNIKGANVAKTIPESVLAPYYPQFTATQIGGWYDRYGEDVLSYLDKTGWR